MQEWLQNNVETFVFNDDETPYVHIQPFMTLLGLDWELERASLKENEHWGYREEEVVEAGATRTLGGLPVDKMFIYLREVDVSRIRPEIRQAIHNYQLEAHQLARKTFLESDLLKYARSRENPTPLERKMIEAADALEREEQS